MTEQDIADIISTIRQVCQSSAPLALHEPDISDLDKQTVLDCLESGWISSVGKYVDAFERQLETFTGAKHAVATVNGTAALHTALLVAGIKPNDEVLVPNLTFIATANTVCYTSAIPHFIDISGHTLGVDPDKLKSYLNQIGGIKNNCLYNQQTGRPISALIIMHSYGHPCKIDEIKSICREYHLKLIEDAAESLGSFYKNQHTGTFGDVAALSFNGNKTMSCGGGGAVLTHRDDYAELAKHLTTTAKINGPLSSEHDHVGYNYRLPNLNAALGVAQLQQLNAKLEQKRVLAKRYQEAFAKHSQLSPFYEPFDINDGSKSNYWLNLLILKKADLKIRDNIINRCIEDKIFVRPAWGLMHRQKMFSQNPHMPDLETSIDQFQRIICLPSSPQLIGQNDI